MSGAALGEHVELAGLTAGNGGVMVGRLDGRAVFVAGALPGERVRVEITDDRHDAYGRARVVDVLDPSPHRVGPRCPAAAGGAGCCDLSFADDTVARSIKGTVVRDLMVRVGGVDEAVAESLIMTQLTPTVGWRTRVRMPVGPNGRPGMHVSEGARIVDTRCAQPVSGLLDAMEEHTWIPGWDAVAVRGDDGVDHLVQVRRAVRSGTARESAPGHRTRNGGRQDRRARAQRSRASTIVESRPVAGPAAVVRRVAGREWRLPATAFWQAHRAAPEFYANTVGSMVERLAPNALTGWDLYGGVGVFAAAVCARVPTIESVVVVEADDAAVTASRAAFADDRRVASYRGPVAGALRALPSPDVVVLDPPRSGAGATVVAGVCAAAPPLIVHVGCDPATFARDLRSYAEQGYRPVEVQVIDAFPLTHHVEVIAALQSVESAGRRGRESR